MAAHTVDREGKLRPVTNAASYQPEPRIYRIIRFCYNGKPRTVRSNVTLTEAQAHCRREDTRAEWRWFDGYDYMRGCAPKER